MKKTMVMSLAVLFLACGLFANGLNLNGLGARPASMGGAFVGLADDFTAVFWNPAGLALLKSRTFGLAGDLLLPSARFTLDPTFSMETKAKGYGAGLVGYFQPIGDRIVVGLGAYTLSGLGADWASQGFEEALVYPLPPAYFTPSLGSYRWRSFIGSVTLAPSIAVRVNDWMLLGATFNLSYGFFQTSQWAETAVLPTKPPTLVNLGQQDLDIDGWGFGATIGLLIKPIDGLSVGLTWRTQTNMSLSGTMGIENLDRLGLPVSSDTSLEVPNPTWLAGGIAVKPVDRLTVTFDLQWTNWAKLGTLELAFADPEWAEALTDEAALVLNWKDSLQVRGGVEYAMGKFALRAGYYYDPAPAPDETMNVLIPSFTYNSFNAGFGYAKDRWKIDFGLEYLIGTDRTITEGVMPGLYEMSIWVPKISVGYTF
jgi:long-chain fatty acid transport protein